MNSDDNSNVSDLIIVKSGISVTNLQRCSRISPFGYSRDYLSQQFLKDGGLRECVPQMPSTTFHLTQFASPCS